MQVFDLFVENIVILFKYFINIMTYLRLTQDAQNLLQKSNEYLQYLGQPPIESVDTSEMFEMA